MAPNEFWESFSRENKLTFGSLLIPKLQTLSPLQDCSPRSLLHSAGVHSRDDVIDRRTNQFPIELGQVDDDGLYSPFRSRLTALIKEFFVGDSIHLTKHTGREHEARRPPQHFDIRRIGTCQIGGVGDTVELFCCRYGESTPTTANPYASSWETRDEHLHPRDIRLAIPSRAGLCPPDAVSLVHPLQMFPREYVEEGEAGAVLACAVGIPGFSAQLYWDDAAYEHSLNRVQEIGRELIRNEVPAQVALRERGEHVFSGASAILSMLYETAAQFGQTQEVPIFAAGVWGVAIHPRRDGTHMGQLGIIGVEVNFKDATPGEALLPSRERCLAVINCELKRDDFGFLSIIPERCRRLPMTRIDWYEQLPDISLS